MDLIYNIGPALITTVSLALLIGVLLGAVKAHLPRQSLQLVEQIDACLPQIQCAQCGYPGCRPYAAALAGGAPINLCPPGGDITIGQLAALLERDPLPLHEELKSFTANQVARIDESSCIGCSLCIKACPVDAIVGANGFMHTVLASYCTGCELCLPPCPVDCITLVAER